jgi:phytoene dehydrogenase-like protein
MIDANIVGSGPNGLACAVVLARCGLEVQVHERADRPGGALRSLDLTCAGYLQDLGPTVMPLAYRSPLLRRLGIVDALQWSAPPLAFAHPLPHGRTVLGWSDLQRTADELGTDGPGWRRLFEPLTRDVDALAEAISSVPAHLQHAPQAAEQLRADVIGSVRRARHRPRTPEGRALLAGLAAHIPAKPSSTVAALGALVLGAFAQAGSWATPVGGARRLAQALVADLLAHGGKLIVSHPVDGPADLPPARATFLDTGVDFLDRFGGDALPSAYRQRLHDFAPGPALARVSFTLDGPVPWEDPRVSAAAVVHVGGAAEEFAAAGAELDAGLVPDAPAVVLVQSSVIDPSRAPEGKASVGAYVTLPNGCEVDPTQPVIDQIERFAPGFGQTLISAAHIAPPRYEALNPNFVGGDAMTGALTLGQVRHRPVPGPTPWRTPVPGLYLCSAAAAPGPGVHGMVGYRAAACALRDLFGVRLESVADIPD